MQQRATGGSAVLDNSKSATIHTPRSLHDLGSTLQRVKEPTLFAGGTYLMHSPSFYPCDTHRDIVYLGEISEFKRISRNDRTLEIGSMVNLEHIMSAGKQALPNLLLSSIANSGTLIVRRQSTLGGALAIPSRRIALSGALASLDAEVQVYTLKNQRLVSTWKPIRSLYERNGTLRLSSKEIIGGVRISDEKESFSSQMIAGDIMRKPEESAIASLACFERESLISRFNISLIFPESLFIVPPDLTLQMIGMTIPLKSSQMGRVRRLMEEHVDQVVQNSLPHLQRERGRRLIEALLHSLNIHGLS